MTERDVIEMAIELAKKHGLQLSRPMADGTNPDVHSMTFWKPSDALSEKYAVTTFAYYVSELEGDGQYELLRYRAIGAIQCLYGIEKEAAQSGERQGCGNG